MSIGLRKIIRLYKLGNVSISGNCGSGKDLLQANVIVRRRAPYVSNVDYGGEFYPLDFSKLDCGSTFENFLLGDLKEYTYPYPLGADVYISDCGIYMPSQYCNDLNKKYSRLPTFFAIRRHVARCNIHCNSQHLGRVWDKLREQGDTYIVARRAIVIFGYVFQLVTIYDRYDSAEMRIKPCRVTRPLTLNAEARMTANVALDNFTNSHGNVQNMILIYRNKSTYDTHHFYKLLKGDESKLEAYKKDRTFTSRLRSRLCYLGHSVCRLCQRCKLPRR